jgi:alpha-amylase
MSVVPGTGNGQSNQWRTSVTLPANATIKYKYIKKGANGDVIWESGASRVVNTPVAGQTTALTETWK